MILRIVLIFFALFGVIQIVTGKPFTSLLAGPGIGGLALALAGNQVIIPNDQMAIGACRKYRKETLSETGDQYYSDLHHYSGKNETGPADNKKYPE